MPTRTDPVAALLRAHDDQDRRPMHVVICAHSYKALQDFADEHGATVTGLVDALAHGLSALTHADPELERLVAAAAVRVDVERRRKRYEG